MKHQAVILVAGGVGHRMGGSLPKQFLMLGAEPVLVQTINRFAEAVRGVEIVVVLPEQYVDFWKNLSARFEVAAHRVVAGGATRFESVQCGLRALTSKPELIAVHDGVRPLVSVQLIDEAFGVAAETGSAIPAILVTDSLRESNGWQSHPVDRTRMRCVQTPQVFRSEWLLKAYQQPYNKDFTDDATVVEAAGYSVRLIEGERANLKITTPEDRIIAEALLAAQNTPEEEQLDGKEL